jgi:hypothetical protein
MSLKIVYPDGSWRVYNDANFLYTSDTSWSLYTKQAGQWVASIQVSAGAVVETRDPCSASMPSDRAESMLEELKGARLEIGVLRRKLRETRKAKKGGAK